MSAQSIVLVEDDEQLQSILARSLRKRGHDVWSTGLGANARRFLSCHTPSVLILDINLPDETGWDVLRWLRQQPGAHPHIIVLTAFRPVKTHMADLAPYRLLNKPFPIDALLRLVDSDGDASTEAVAP